jgi:hypothetical protein
MIGKEIFMCIAKLSALSVIWREKVIPYIIISIRTILKPLKRYMS